VLRGTGIIAGSSGLLDDISEQCDIDGEALGNDIISDIKESIYSCYLKLEVIYLKNKFV
jgi:hypothetical protein